MMLISNSLMNSEPTNYVAIQNKWHEINRTN